MRQEKCGAGEAMGIKAPSRTRVMGLGQKQHLATRDSSLQPREVKKKKNPSMKRRKSVRKTGCYHDAEAAKG